MYRWFLKMRGVIFFLNVGKTHNQPFQGGFSRGANIFSTPKMSWAQRGAI